MNDSRLGRLIRSNAALLFLCVISIGILVLIARKPQGSSDQNGNMNTISLSASAQDAEKRAAYEKIPAGSPFRNMPEPSFFRTFVYKKGEPLIVESECTDMYRVVIVYPVGHDYRADPSASVYNVATKCSDKGIHSATSTPQSIDLDSFGLKEDASYYVIRANQNAQDTWHDPY